MDSVFDDTISRLQRIKVMALRISSEFTRESLVSAVLSDIQGRKIASRLLGIHPGYLKDPDYDPHDLINPSDRKWPFFSCFSARKRYMDLPEWPSFLFDENDADSTSGKDAEDCWPQNTGEDSYLFPDQEGSWSPGDTDGDDDENDNMLDKMFMHLLGGDDEKQRNTEDAAPEDELSDADLDIRPYSEHRPSCLFPAKPAGEISSDKICSVYDLVSRLVKKTTKSQWIRDKVARNMRGLARRLDFAEKRTAEMFPHYRDSIKQLRDLLFTQLSQIFEERKMKPFPVFIFSGKDCDLGPVLSHFGTFLGCVFLKHNMGLDNSSLVKAFRKKIPHMVLFSDCLGKDHYAGENAFFEFALDYFMHGRYYQNSIISLDMAKYEELLNNKAVLFHIQIPEEIGWTSWDPVRRDLSALYEKILEFHEPFPEHAKCKALYDDICSVIRQDNSVAFGPLSAGDIYRMLSGEINSVLRSYYMSNICEPLCKVAMPEILVILIILSNLDKGINEMRIIAKNAVYSLHQVAKKENMPACSIQFERDKTFNKMFLDLKISGSIDRYLARQVNLLRRNHCTLAYDIKLEKPDRRMLIKNIRIEASRKKPKIKYSTHIRGINFKEVIGLEDAKKKMRAFMDYLVKPGPYRRFGVKPENRLLLCGPPGTGKTLIARAFACESRLPFFYISASEIASQKYAGWGASLLRELFYEAKKYKPGIIFIDELDAIRSRENIDESSVGYDATSILNTLLVMLDGIDSEHDIMVLGATNKPRSLDKALVRAKRFGTRINTSALNYEDRKRLVRKNLHSSLCGDSYDTIVDTIAMRTAGDISPALIVSIIEDAKRQALEMAQDMLHLENVSAVLDNKLMGEKTRTMSEKYKKTAAIHEAGHALAVKLLSPRTRISKISIGHRENSSGTTVLNTESLDDIVDEYTRNDLIAEIMYILAGSLAEKIIFGHWGPGSGNDIAMASMLAKYAVIGSDINNGYRHSVRYFMESGEGRMPHDLLEPAIQLIEKCSDKTESMLRQNIDMLNSLADEIYCREDLEKEEVEALLNGISADNEVIIMDVIESLRKSS